MPTLFLIILLSSIVQPNFWWLLGITILFGWMSLVGVVRAEFLRTRNFDYIRAARLRRTGSGDHVPPYAAQRHGGDADLPAVYPVRLDHHPDVARFPRFRSADRFAVARRAAAARQNNLQAPWLGITAFLVLAVLLSLLIFIGEAVRDAFDPSKAH